MFFYSWLSVDFSFSKTFLFFHCNVFFLISNLELLRMKIIFGLCSLKQQDQCLTTLSI